MHFHPLFAVAVIPIAVLFALVFTPYRNYRKNTTGIWFASSSGRRSAALAAAFSAAATVTLVILNEYENDILQPRLELSPIIADGFIPLAVCIAVVFGFMLILRKKISMSDNETVQALFTIFCTTFVFLTLINVGFRGPGMALIFGH